MQNTGNISNKGVGIVILLVSLTVVALSQAMSAQIIRSNQLPAVQKIVVFKGTGIRHKRTIAEPSLARQTVKVLSRAERSALIRDVMLANGAVANASSSAASYASLSASTPFVSNRAYLVSWGTVTTNPVTPGIAFHKGLDDGLEVFIKPEAAGQWFMVECQVHGFGSAAFMIAGPDGSKTEIANAGGAANLQLMMVSQDAQWQEFYIHRNSPWNLKACEISKAN